MVDNLSESHSSDNFNNWDNYQLQINKYLKAIDGNPYVLELCQDFKNISKHKVTKYLNNEWKVKFNTLTEQGKITNNDINEINSLFNTDNMMKLFIKSMTDKISIDNELEILKFISVASMKESKENINLLIPEVVFNPSELKFVTTTGLGMLETYVDYEYLYENFIPPENIVKTTCSKDSGPIFNPEVINTIVGCKTGNEAIKGYFKKSDVGDFYNCATLQIVLGEKKCANAKLFNNGKIQLTGIPHPDLGTVAVKIISDLIKTIPDNKETNQKIVFDKKHVKLKYYKTVMINTCYDLGISIDRDITSQVLSERFNFSTVWEGDGYPGVRVLYYYNTDTVGTENEGLCTCSCDSSDDKCEEKCNGKGSGEGKFNCRKISIAVFQSGKVIIAGGCKDAEPIYSVYNTFNKIVGTIANEITKIDDENIQNKKKHKEKKIFIDKLKITNIEMYKKLLG
tara:strand:+ start:1936 stop:3300 length:1365 start_codon:yes stop_codon:yes gene_type:complete